MTKANGGGRATLQAVTRVKPEQASKVKPWKPGNAGEGKDSHFRSAYEDANMRRLAISLETREAIRRLQRKLYRKRKDEPEYRNIPVAPAKTVARSTGTVAISR